MSFPAPPNTAATAKSGKNVRLPLRNERLPLLVHVSTRPSSRRLIPAAPRPTLRLTHARLGTATRAPTLSAEALRAFARIEV